MLDIKLLRTILGYSQQRLSDETGIPKSRISQWELGNGHPKVDDFNILTNFFTKMGAFDNNEIDNGDKLTNSGSKSETTDLMKQLVKTSDALFECLQMMSYLRKENEALKRKILLLKRGVAEKGEHMAGDTGPEKGRAETA